MQGYQINTRVEWEWGKGTATGKVQSRYTERVTKNIKGNEVTRDATKSNPAYLIEQEDGDRVLKSHEEVRQL